MDRSWIYRIAYALAARDGRQDALFGNCAPLAQQAFERSCAGEAFPEVWFEMPLTGEPWFDLHVLTARETLAPGMQFSPDDTGGYPELFEWFAGAPDVRQLALSYDVSGGAIDKPAVQLLVWDQRMHEPFLELAGGTETRDAYHAFAKRIPEGWFPCYTGVFPGRPGSNVRVECIPLRDLQRAYAADASLLESHLRQVGFTEIDDTLIPRCQALAQDAFQFELQFDVRPDGTMGDTLGASARFAAPGDKDGRVPFSMQGAAGELMTRVEQWGLADERWRLLAETMFVKTISQGSDAVTAYTFPAFVKLRWRGGEPLDAKTYLIAGLQDPKAPPA